MNNEPSIGIKVIAYLEILGSIGLLGVVTFQFLGQLPPGIYLLNLIFATAVFIIGMGLLRLKSWARILIIFQAIYGVTRAVIEITLRFSSPQTLKWIYFLLFSLFIIWFFTRKSAKEQFKSDTGTEPVLPKERVTIKKKWIVTLLVGLMLPVFIVGTMLIFCSSMMRIVESWAKREVELSPIQQFLIAFCAFFRENCFFLTLVALILCIAGAIAVLILNTNKQKKDPKIPN